MFTARAPVACGTGATTRASLKPTHRFRKSPLRRDAARTSVLRSPYRHTTAVANASATSSTVALTKKSPVDLPDFVSWIQTNGGKGKGLSLDTAKYEGERCLVATNDIPAGKPLLAFPWSMGLNDDPALLEGPPMEDAHWGVVLAARLVQEYMRGDQSTWQSYIGVLPESVPALWYLAAREALDGDAFLNEVQYGPVVGMAKAMAADVTAAHKRLAGADGEVLMGASLDEFLWAVSMVHSRSFEYEEERPDGSKALRHVMMPLADMLNHRGEEYTLPDPEELPAAPVPGARPELGAVVELEGDANHNMEYLSDAAPDAVYFVATREMAAGEEAALSYGDRSNDHFLLYYGFVPQRNPHDDFVLFENVEAVLDWYGQVMGTGAGGEQWEARKQAARQAVNETEVELAMAGEGELVSSEPRLKLLSGLRIDARLLSALSVLSLPIKEGEKSQQRARVRAVQGQPLEFAYKLVQVRCQELLEGFATTLEADLKVLCSTGSAAARAQWQAVWERNTDLEVTRLLRQGYMATPLAGPPPEEPQQEQEDAFFWDVDDDDEEGSLEEGPSRAEAGTAASGDGAEGEDQVRRMLIEYRAHKKLLLADTARRLAARAAAAEHAADA